MNVLLIKMSSMGDIIHTLPAITDAQKAIPGINFDWVVEENFAEIPKWHPAVKNIIPVAIRRWRHMMFRAVKNGEISWFLHNLRAKSYDYVIDAQGLIKSAAVALFAHGVKCGYDKTSAREPLANVVYKKKLAIAKNLHAITRTRKLFATILNYNNISDMPSYGIGIDTSHFATQNYDDNYLVFVHGTTAKKKCWADNSWQELARLAVEAGFKVKIPWSNTEELQRAKYIAATHADIEVLPKLDLTSLGSLMLKAKGVVAIDTGLGHLAAALNVPTISLYGPTDPNLIGTLGAQQIHLTNFTKVTAADVRQKVLENFG